MKQYRIGYNTFSNSTRVLCQSGENDFHTSGNMQSVIADPPLPFVLIGVYHRASAKRAFYTIRFVTHLD